MDYLPVFLQLNDSACLVVGGGAVAERKVRLLMRAGAAVTVVARDLNGGLAQLREAGRISYHPGEFSLHQLDGMRIVTSRLCARMRVLPHGDHGARAKPDTG